MTASPARALTVTATDEPAAARAAGWRAAPSTTEVRSTAVTSSARRVPSSVIGAASEAASPERNARFELRANRLLRAGSDRERFTGTTLVDRLWFDADVTAPRGGFDF